MTRKALGILGAVGVSAVILASSLLGTRPNGGPPTAWRARVPAIDMHAHIGGINWPGDTPDFAKLIRGMDETNVETLVDFKVDKVWGSVVSAKLAQYAPYPGRFLLFCNVPIKNDRDVFLGDLQPDYPETAAAALEDAIRRGARGLKISSELGRVIRGTDGLLTPVDHPKLDAVWERAARLRVPVLIHTGMYRWNHQPGKEYDFVRWELVQYERERIFRRHPRTLFIAAHFASADEDIPYMSYLMDTYPNVYLDSSSHSVEDLFAKDIPFTQAYFARYQDRILFASDWMENVWLDYGPRNRDILLKWINLWNLPDPIYEKFFRKNAEKLLKISPDNGAPVAHAGFTQTRILGQPVILDGSASYDVEGSPLSYHWTQVTGPTRAVLLAARSARTAVTALGVGTYVFRLTVSDGELSSTPHQVQVNVVVAANRFREQDGRVVIEAEHYSQKMARGGHDWVLDRTQPGFSGAGYMQAVPADGAVQETNLRAQSAELQYAVEIARSGTYVVVLRGSGLRGTGDSVHLGLDGEEVPFADKIGPFDTDWTWIHTARDRNWRTGSTEANLAILNIMEPGIHLVHVWMHKAGFRLDKIILVRHASSESRFAPFDPAPGTGPLESPRLRGLMSVRRPK